MTPNTPSPRTSGCLHFRTKNDRSWAFTAPTAELACQVIPSLLELEHLMVAMHCCGSERNSSITANPAPRVASDILAAHVRTAILLETPVIYGAEGLLTPSEAFGFGHAESLP